MKLLGTASETTWVYSQNLLTTDGTAYKRHSLINFLKASLSRLWFSHPDQSINPFRPDSTCGHGSFRLAIVVIPFLGLGAPIEWPAGDVFCNLYS